MRRPSRRCGLDGGLHRGSFAWYPGPNLTRKPHEPCACSPLSGQTYGAFVHSPCGGRPTWSDCGGRRCGLDGGLHRGSFAWHQGLDPTLKPHGPLVWSRLAIMMSRAVCQWDSIYVDGATCQVDKRGLINLKLNKTSFYI
jgi:hypothetical protein